ncbi:hypothetical protein ACHAWF_010677 [Thalassiosira exigua]
MAATQTTDSCRKSSSSLPAAATVPLALGVVASTLKLLLWRSRIVARGLDDDASKVWSDGSMMLDCSNGELHRAIVQSAIARGAAALESTLSGPKDVPKYYQSNTSSGVSSDNDDAVSTPSNENGNGNGKEGLSTPKKMGKQVGGIASHKRPVLTLDRFILKPLRVVLAPLFNLERGNEVCLEKAGFHKTEGVGHATAEPLTKAYRGMREAAFYEAMEFASALPSDLSSHCEFFHKISKNGPGSIEIMDSMNVVLYLLHLSSMTPARNISSGHQPFFQSFLQSCQYPCVGFHEDKQRTNLETISVQHGRWGSFSTPQYNLGYIDSIALTLAQYAGDPDALSSINRYADSWHSLIKELDALKCLLAVTSPYFGLADLDSLEEGRSPHLSRATSLRKPHLLLQNLTIPYRHPNIIDIKMGTQTFEPAAPISKQTREAAKYPQQLEFGFRIVGMKVYCPSSDDYIYWDKKFGVNLKTQEEVVHALKTFFRCGEAGRDTSYAQHVVNCVVSQLAQIKNWFAKENRTLAFYASSILIVYDGIEPTDAPFAYQEPILKMIDFAHVCRQSGGDQGYLKGIKNLCNVLEDILAQIS